MSAVSLADHVCSPWWPAIGGRFLPFELAADRSRWTAETHELVSRIVEARVPGAVFLRGSVVESASPFFGADVDVLVVTEQRFGTDDIARLRGLSPRPMDLKIFDPGRLAHEPVQRALIAHRSVQISGPSLVLEPSLADRQHARDQWLGYLPFALPATLETADPYAVFHFKCAARAFGVLSLLRDGRFTREIDSCLEWASVVDEEAADVLTNMRRDLEHQCATRYELRRIRHVLVELFDRFAVAP